MFPVRQPKRLSTLPRNSTVALQSCESCRYDEPVSGFVSKRRRLDAIQRSVEKRTCFNRMRSYKVSIINMMIANREADNQSKALRDVFLYVVISISTWR
jgi:hypothetical protein